MGEANPEDRTIRLPVRIGDMRGPYLMALQAMMVMSEALEASGITPDDEVRFKP